jgi:uncharacterized protein
MIPTADNSWFRFIVSPLIDKLFDAHTSLQPATFTSLAGDNKFQLTLETYGKVDGCYTSFAPPQPKNLQAAMTLRTTRGFAHLNTFVYVRDFCGSFNTLLYNCPEMRRRTRVTVIHCFLLGWILLRASVWLAAEPIASLKPSNYVNDFAGVLDAATQASLNDLCQQVDQKAHAQIAVVTVKSLDGQDAVSYAVALYQKWGIGAKGKDRGVLILLATNDHKYWTTVGYGLEGILPDGKVGGFGRDMLPALRSGNYAAAVISITTRVATVIAEDAGVKLENQPEPRMPRQQPGPDIGAGAVVVLILIVLFVVIPILRAIFRGGGPGRGGGSGLLSGILWGMLFSNLGGGRGGYGGGGFGGGGFGGGGFGGGGFGGFGGGSTGGGGAGGSW